MRLAIIQFGMILLTLMLVSCASYPPAEFDEERYTRAELEEDFDAFLEFVKTMHPDLSYSADINQLDIEAVKARGVLRDGMTVRDAWMAMAVVNPIFADAHIGLRRPVAALEKYKNAGGALFPVAVVIENDGTLRVASNVQQGLSISSGDVILAINGIPAHDIIASFAPRMRGETEALGRLVMALYFPEYFWIAHGGYDRYVLKVRNQTGVRLVDLSLSASSASDGSDTHFTYKKLNDEVGYLSITSFDIQHLDVFKSFLSSAFAQIKEDGVGQLIIDLRENTGGARDLSDLLMAYLTDAPYSAISRVTARITQENIQLIPGSKLGDVVTIPFQQVVTPPDNYPLRFDGEIYALVGGLTYSQAIVFAATLQDFDIALIAGEPTEGPANQTGQVQRTVLPNTGIEGLAPIYIFTRANGDTSRNGVIPEIKINNDPLDPMQSVNDLLDRIAE